MTWVRSCNKRRYIRFSIGTSIIKIKGDLMILRYEVARPAFSVINIISTRILLHAYERSKDTID